jgi:hypothetical protein
MRSDGPDPRGDDGAGLLEDSVLIGGAQRAIRAVVNASGRSRVLVAGHALWRQYAASPHRRRIQLAGVGLTAFAATYLALTLVVPSRVAPLFPAAVWGSAGALGGLCLTAADALVAALGARQRRMAQNSEPSVR